MNLNNNEDTESESDEGYTVMRSDSMDVNTDTVENPFFKENNNNASELITALSNLYRIFFKCGNGTLENTEKCELKTMNFTKNHIFDQQMIVKLKELMLKFAKESSNTEERWDLTKNNRSARELASHLLTMGMSCRNKIIIKDFIRKNPLCDAIYNAFKKLDDTYDLKLSVNGGKNRKYRPTRRRSTRRRSFRRRSFRRRR